MNFPVLRSAMDIAIVPLPLSLGIVHSPPFLPVS